MATRIRKELETQVEAFLQLCCEEVKKHTGEVQPIVGTFTSKPNGRDTHFKVNLFDGGGWYSGYKSVEVQATWWLQSSLTMKVVFNKGSRTITEDIMDHIEADHSPTTVGLVIGKFYAKHQPQLLKDYIGDWNLYPRDSMMGLSHLLMVAGSLNRDAKANKADKFIHEVWDITRDGLLNPKNLDKLRHPWTSHNTIKDVRDGGWLSSSEFDKIWPKKILNDPERHR